LRASGPRRALRLLLQPARASFFHLGGRLRRLADGVPRPLAARHLVMIRIDVVVFAHRILNLRKAPTPPTSASSDASSMKRIFAAVWCAFATSASAGLPFNESGAVVIRSSSTDPISN